VLYFLGRGACVQRFMHGCLCPWHLLQGASVQEAYVGGIMTGWLMSGGGASAFCTEREKFIAYFDRLADGVDFRLLVDGMM